MYDRKLLNCTQVKIISPSGQHLLVAVYTGFGIDKVI